MDLWDIKHGMCTRLYMGWDHRRILVATSFCVPRELDGMTTIELLRMYIESVEKTNDLYSVDMFERAVHH